MFCTKCGREIPARSSFCPYCGETIVRADAKPPKPPKAPKPQKPKKPKSTKLGGPILALVLCLLLMLSSAAYLFVPGLAQDVASGGAQSPARSPHSASELRYNTSAIEKETPDTSALSDLSGSAEEAQAMLERSDGVKSALAAGESAVSAEYPEVTEDNIEQFLGGMSEIAYDMYSDGMVDYYEMCDTGILFTFDDGSYYYYSPEIEGLDAGSDGTPELYVSTYQPCLPSYEGTGVMNYVHLIDDAAEEIDDTFDAYSFEASANYDVQAVNPESCAAMGQYSVILWHGHGAYSRDLGCLLVTGLECNAENYQKYAKAIKNGSLISGGDTFLIGSDFVENYIPDGSLNNSILYLGSCSSGRDDELVDAFLSKGAAAVFANSQVIASVYNLEMINAVCDGLCQTNSDGSYYSVSEALDYAKDKVAPVDPYADYGAEVLLFTDNPELNLEWYKGMMVSDRSVVLALDSSGSMDGDPIYETKEAAHLFVSSVLDENAAVGIVSYDYDAELRLGFSADRSVLDSAIDDIYAGGSTNTYAGLATAESLLSVVDSEQKIIVLMSDGMPNDGLCGDELIEYAQSLKDKGITIYTLGFFQDLYSAEKYEAQQLMDAIASDGRHYEVSDADDLQFFFGDIADQVNGQLYIFVKIACPVDVTVKYKGETLCSEADRLSTRSSFGSLSFENSEDGEDAVKVLRLKAGAEYDIKIEGTGRGSMDYTVGYMDENGEYTDFRRFNNIDIGRRTVIDTAVGSTGDTLLSVDYDGDGRYELEYKAGANEKGKPVDRTLQYIVFGVGCASALGAVVSAVILSVRVKRRKTA